MHTFDVTYFTHTQAKKQKNLRWYNPQTKEFSWEDPRYLTPWRAVVSEKGVRLHNLRISTFLSC